MLIRLVAHNSRNALVIAIKTERCGRVEWSQNGRSLETFEVSLGKTGIVWACRLMWSAYCLLLAIWRIRFRRERVLPQAGNEPGDDASFAFGSFEELRAWVSSDDPITAMEKDIFHHGGVAKRIAARLTSPNPPSQAVVGRLGAGKTTLLHLVRDHLRVMGADKRVRVVAAELWPYETSRAAVQGVIRTLVHELSKEVNVVGIRGIAAEYAEAMSAAGGIWSALARLQGIPTNPNDALAALDDMATAIGIRIVVWIEDLERFAGSSAEMDEERLNPIRSLLYGLDKLRSITVITATTSLQHRFDIEKIARFVEKLPDLPEQEVSKILALFRKSCAERADIIDPALPHAREPLQHLAEERYFAIRRSILGPLAHNIADAVTGLCSTPRALKQALRICIESWDKLAGEIDFDDLLVLSILRESEPDVLSIMEDHLHHLRGSWVSSEKDKQAEASAWKDALVKAVPDERRRTLVSEAADFLFKDQADQRPQGVRQHNHADYWERYLTMPELGVGERDQPVLKVLASDDDSALLQFLSDPASAAAVYDFRHLVPTERVARLLLPLVELRSRESAQEWPDHEPPGLVPLWRLWLRAVQRGDLKSPAVLDYVVKALDQAIPSNLTLAAELENHFVVAEMREGDPMQAAEAAQAKKHLRAKLVATYQGNGAALAAGLRGAPPPVLLWICWGLDKVRAHAMNDLPFDDWAKFRDAILEAGRAEPATMLPQVAGLLVRDLALGRGVNYQFDEDAANHSSSAIVQLRSNASASSGIESRRIFLNSCIVFLLGWAGRGCGAPTKQLERDLRASPGAAWPTGFRGENFPQFAQEDKRAPWVIGVSAARNRSGMGIPTTFGGGLRVIWSETSKGAGWQSRRARCQFHSRDRYPLPERHGAIAVGAVRTLRSGQIVSIQGVAST